MNEKNPNLAEAFSEIRERCGAEVAVRKLAYWDAFLEGQLIDEFNKSRGTRPLPNDSDIINDLRAKRVRLLPKYILNRPIPEKEYIVASKFTLSYHIDRLLIKEEYPVLSLADKLCACLFDLYKKDGMFPLSIYTGCYNMLKGLIPE